MPLYAAIVGLRPYVTIHRPGGRNSSEKRAFDDGGRICDRTHEGLAQDGGGGAFVTVAGGFRAKDEFSSQQQSGKRSR